MLGLVAGTSVQAQQNYPSGPVTFVVPLPPGGTVDIIARAVAERLQSYTGQPFLVENVTGGATTIAAERVARAPADGYTLLVATSSTLSSNPHFYRKLRYRIADFQPISLLSKNEFVVHIRRTLPASNLNELIAYAARTPGGITFATVGRGSTSEVLGELMKATFKVEISGINGDRVSPVVAMIFDRPLPRCGIVEVMLSKCMSTTPFITSVNAGGAPR